MNSKALRAIAASFGPPGTAELAVNEEGLAFVRTDLWDWTFEQIKEPPGVAPTFDGEMYQLLPDVHISGGAGLRPRWFAVIGDRSLCLDREDHMRSFLKEYASKEDPVALADLLETCQGKGRMANIYRADGFLEKQLDEPSRSEIAPMGLAEPALAGDELTFFAWQVGMAEGHEVVSVDRWTLSMSEPGAPRWSSAQVPGLLRMR